MTRITREEILHTALLHCDGVLSATRIHEVIGRGVVTVREMRELVSAVIEDGLANGLELDGIRYMLKKVRNYYLLEPVEVAA